MAITNFTDRFVTFFKDATDPQRRFERLARLLVEEVTHPHADYTGSDAVGRLQLAMRPIMQQEMLMPIAPAFFGGIHDSETRYLLEEVARYRADPAGYVAPPPVDEWIQENDATS